MPALEYSNSMPWVRENLAPESKVLIRVTAFAYFISLVLFPKLWILPRDIPKVPLLPMLEGATLIPEAFFYFFSLISCLSLMIAPGFWPGAILLVSCWLCSALFDQLRLQVFYYWYSLYLLVTLFNLNKQQQKHSLMALSVALYFWAGFSKLNWGFAYDMFPWFIHPITIKSGWILVPLSIMAALWELLAGLLLLFPRTRKIGVGFTVLLHVTILLKFLPYGMDYMPIVPWNILQLVAVCVLFLSDKSKSTTILVPKDITGAIARTLVFICPALSIFGLWDDILSFRLFSGAALQSNLIVNQAFLDRVGSPVGKIVKREGELFYLPLPHWSLLDSGHQFLSDSYFKRVFKKLCDKKTADMEMRLVINYHLKNPVLYFPVKNQDKIWSCADAQLE